MDAASGCASWRRCLTGHLLTILGVGALVAYLNWRPPPDAAADLASLLGENASVVEPRAFADGFSDAVQYYRFRATRAAVDSLAARLGLKAQALSKSHLGHLWAIDPPAWWRPVDDLPSGVYYGGRDAKAVRYSLAHSPASGVTYLVRVTP